MSAIGDYIHLHAFNYDRYGTAKGGSRQSMTDSYNAQLAMHRARLSALENRGINEATLGELKERIKYNYNESVQAKQIAENAAKFHNGVEGYQQRFKQKLIEEVPSKLTSESNISLNQSKMNINSNPVNFEKAKNYRTRAINSINLANQRYEEGKPIAKNTIDAIQRNTDLFFKELGMIEGKDVLNMPEDLRNQDTLAALKGILEIAPLNEMNEATFSGIFGEVIVNMAADTARVIAGEQIVINVKEVEKGLSAGEIRSSFKLDEEMIQPKVQKIFQEQTGLNLYQARSSQNKVDASITIKDQKVEASIKAYTPKNNTIKAHLQDVSLLDTLAVTQAQFANHWISIHSYGRTDSAMDTLLTDQIKYEAMSSGNLLKKDAIAADTFVAIDTTNGRVYVESIYDILTNGGVFTLNPAIENILIHSNNWADTWEQRISNIIMSLQKMKIEVMYKVSLKPL